MIPFYRKLIFLEMWGLLLQPEEKIV